MVVSDAAQRTPDGSMNVSASFTAEKGKAPNLARLSRSYASVVSGNDASQTSSMGGSSGSNFNPASPGLKAAREPTFAEFMLNPKAGTYSFHPGGQRASSSGSAGGGSAPFQQGKGGGGNAPSGRRKGSSSSSSTSSPSGARARRGCHPIQQSLENSCSPTCKIY